MNTVQIYKNENFGEIRSTMIDGEPWFVGKDIAATLGYLDTDQAIRAHVDEEDKLTRSFNGSGQGREMTIINESGLYSLILSSKLPSARDFKRWVTSEVLPSIRKTGKYESARDVGLIIAEQTSRQLQDIMSAVDKLEKKVDSVEKSSSFSNFYLRMLARSGYDQKWLARQNPKIKAIAEFIGVDQKTLLREIYVEMESRYGIELNAFCNDYKRSKGLTTCSTLTVISLSLTLREMFNAIVDEMVSVCGIDIHSQDHTSSLIQMAMDAATNSSAECAGVM